MRFHRSAVFVTALALQDLAGAFRLGIQGTPAKRSSRRGLSRRASITGGQSTLTDSADIQYRTNLTLNGQSFDCLIDTGSADLWVAGSVSNAVDTGATSSVSYAVGEVQGSVMTASLGFAGFTVSAQAYLQISPDGTNPEGQGLIGLGPSFGSNVKSAVGTSAGDPTDTSTPNYLTVLLSRSDDPDEPFPGNITIGETVPGYDAVTSQPKVSVTSVPSGDSGNEHWQVLLDSNGIIGPDGNFITYKTQVPSTKDTSQMTVVFDSGKTNVYALRSVAQSIYGKIAGAQLTNITGLGTIWQLPCTAEVNLTFVFSGQKYPIHPLDTVLNGTDLQITDGSGTDICIGSFQPLSFDASFGSGAAPTFDAVLGMAFLRNAYLLVNFGDFVDGTSVTANPYVQLLSLTNNTAEVHKDFVNVRLGGKDTTINLNNGNGSSSSSSSSSTSPKNWWDKLSSTTKKIIIASAAGGACLIVLLLAFCCCCRSRGARANAGTGVMGFGGQTYRPLNEPAPGAATETYALPNVGYNQPPPPGYGNYPYSQQQYQTAWDPRY
ncbi:hypothetical protein HWV62_2792 [Athelia sp. TMB]|nr:hypothetical protein HWV62_2792 [Athelia sp. TMB]